MILHLMAKGLLLAFSVQSRFSCIGVEGRMLCDFCVAKRKPPTKNVTKA